MTDEDLISAIRRIGKRAFVEHFRALQAYAAGELASSRLEDELAGSGRRLAFRPGYAKKIFQSGRGCDALSIIASPIESPRVAEDVRAKARKLFSALC